MFNLSHLISSVFVLLCFSLFGQISHSEPKPKSKVNEEYPSTLAGRSVLKLPGKYNYPIINENFEVDLSSTTDVLNTRWIVYSDRDRNITYKKAGDSDIKTEISFLDEFYVLEEEGDFLRIVKDDNIRQFTLSKSAVDYGWIHKDNLLLWRRCLTTRKGRIDQKAMILNTLAHLLTPNAEDEPNIVRFKRGPSQSSDKSGIESNLFQFFFVYKVTEEFVLLGKEIRIPTSQQDRYQAMVGWAPKIRLTFWNSRVALEPNWEIAAVAERKRTGFRAKIFLNDHYAKDYKNRKKVEAKNVYWDADPLSTERLIGEWRRFPVLGIVQNDPSIMEVGVLLEKYNEPVESLFFIKAATTLNIKDLKYPLFKKILLLSMEDLVLFKDVITKLADATNSAQQRQLLQETWLQLLKIYLGGDEEIKYLTLEQINEKVIVLPVATPFLKQVRLSDIVDEKRFTEEKLLVFFGSIIESERKLNQILEDSDYPYSFSANGTRYLWIAEDLLP
jgi:hypothetical protein